jgi:hypothetical protein
VLTGKETALVAADTSAIPSLNMFILDSCD